MQITIKALAGLAFVLGFAMATSALVAITDRDQAAAILFAGYAAVLLFIALGIRLALGGRKAPLTREGGFRVLILAWFVVPIVVAPPFLHLTDLPRHLALFEAVSAFTTTGSSALVNLDAVPRAIISWRAWLQWLGGLATLMTIVVVLAPSGAGGTPLLRLGGNAQQIFDNRVRGVVGAYLAVTLACFALLLVSGLSAFEAFCLTLATVSTGGMMPRPGTLSDFGVPMAEWVVAIFMLIGASSLMWHRLVATGRLGRSVTLSESLALGVLALVLGLAYGFSFALAAGSGTVLGPLDALREGFVTAASLVSTTGFEARNAGATALPLSVVLVVLLVGGGMFSTAGGVKIYRLSLMARHSLKELEHIIYPHAVHTDHMGRLAYDTDGMRAIWTALVLFLCVWAASSLVLAFEGFPPAAALTATLSALVNAGPVYTSGWTEPGQWPLYSDLSPVAAFTLGVVMIAGRLEVIGLVAGVGLLLMRR